MPNPWGPARPMPKTVAIAAFVAATGDLIVLLNEDVTQEQADTWLMAARAWDFNGSHFYPEIRDALRDNCPHLDLP